MPVVKYISDVDPNGRLRVRLDRGTVIALPYYLKVNYINTSQNRDYFKILEGENSNRNASVFLAGGGRSYLISGLSHSGPANVVFNKSNGILIVRALATMTAVTSNRNPIPNGTYDIEIPAAPHTSGSNYRSSSRYADTWFRIGRSGDRFLHCGRVPAGCLTVAELSSWSALYNKLIRSRKNNRNVGTVRVR